MGRVGAREAQFARLRDGAVRSRSNARISASAVAATARVRVRDDSCYRGFVPSPLLALSLSLIGVIESVPPPGARDGLLLFAPAERRDGDFEAALAAVEQANIAVNNDPEANLADLAAAIERLSSFGPQIAASSKAREELELSLLNLARALLLTGDEDRAATIMDQVIRGAYGRKLPVKRFGPTLADFHDKRRAQLEARGTAAIQVRCRAACRVVIDTQPATTDSGPLYLGEHRVWIESVDGEIPSVELEVELREAGATEVISFPAEDPTCPEPEPIVIEPPPPPPPPPKRILPRWAEISVAAIGVGAMVAGGVMLGLDGKCPGGLDPIADASRCPLIYEGTVPGLVAIGVGSALVVAGAVTLSLDEVRVGQQRGRQALVTWQMRF